MLYGMFHSMPWGRHEQSRISEGNKNKQKNRTNGPIIRFSKKKKRRSPKCTHPRCCGPRPALFFSSVNFGSFLPLQMSKSRILTIWPEIVGGIQSFSNSSRTTVQKPRPTDRVCSDIYRSTPVAINHNQRKKIVLRSIKSHLHLRVYEPPDN
jgi:hypothetical protein